MSDRAVQVNALFTEALDRPELERTALLDARCGDDAWLRAEVEELLRLAHSPAPVFDAWIAADAQWHAGLLVPAGASPGASPGSSTDSPGELPEGHRLGAWRIGRRIGQGGMGTVFLAARADGQYEQRAALKLVHAYGTAEDIERGFARERRILASLNHPNVARLFDGGQADDGRLFFVMEYVDGLPIDRWCDERRAAIAERLDLFVKVCAGVQHAHDQLVVHRDLKPSNILVSESGEVKLLDFGIARLLASADDADGEGNSEGGAKHEPATRVLTPEYASPEQFRGEHVAIASDVYQLGLLLYVLLTGHHAHDAREIGARGLSHVICEQTPVRPSLRAAAADDVRCLARRTTRTAFARTLRGDLDQIILCALRKEPDQRYASVRDFADDVLRYRRQLPVRAAGLGRRYRLRKFARRHRAALAWGTAAVTAAGVMGYVLVGAQWRAAREAEYAARVEGMVLDLFSLPTSGAQAGLPGTVDYLDQATRVVRTEFGQQPERQSRLFVQLGRTYSLLGHYQPAADLFREAATLRQSLYGAQHSDVAQALEWLGQTEHYQGHYDQAEASLRRAWSIRRTSDGLAPDDAVVPLLELGYLLHSRGKLTEAESTLRQAVSSLRRRSEAYGLARGLRDLGNVLRDRGLYDESAAAYREGIQIYRGLPYPVDPTRQAALTETNYGRLLIQQGALAEAEPLLVSALAALRPLYEGSHPNIASAQRELGYLRLEQGRFAEADQQLTESVAVFDRWLGADHPLVWRTRVHQADLARRQGRHADAIALAERILDRLPRFGLSDHPAAIDVRLILGEALASQHRTTDAARVLTDGLARAERQFVPTDARTRRFRQVLASAGLQGRAQP